MNADGLRKILRCIDACDQADEEAQPAAFNGLRLAVLAEFSSGVDVGPLRRASPEEEILWLRSEVERLTKAEADMSNAYVRLRVILGADQSRPEGENVSGYVEGVARMVVARGNPLAQNPSPYTFGASVSNEASPFR